MVTADKKESKFVSVVVYLHNDSRHIVPFFDTVLGMFRDNFEKYEIICVNDASTDDSVKILKDYFEKGEETGKNGLSAMSQETVESAEAAGKGNKNGRETLWNGSMINIIHMSYFQGLEASMNAGRDMAIGDFVYEFDDINPDYPPELIRDVYDRMLSGYDIVAASCKGKIKLTSRLFYLFYNLTSSSRNKIGQETFRILSRRAINRVMSMGQYIPYRKAVYVNCGLKTDTVYYESRSSVGRHKSKTDGNERMSLAIDSFIYFTNVLERLSLVVSGAFLLFTLGVAVYIACSFFSANKPVEGWLSTMGFLSLGFFGVFSLLTFILKYLSVMLSLIFKHQRYLIEGVEKISKQ